LDLQPWLFNRPATRARSLIAETWRYTAAGAPIIDLVAAMDGRRKVLLNAVDQTYRTFAVSGPDEAPTSSDDRECEALRRYLDEYVEQTGGALETAH